MNIETLAVGPLMTNCYVVYEGGEAVIIDPGDEADKISGFIDSHGLKPLAIMLTHSHFDHVGAAEEIKDKYHIPLVIHENERHLLENKERIVASPYMSEAICITPDKLLSDGEKYAPFSGDGGFLIIATPGHTEGGASYYMEEANAVFTGDTLFYMSIGRSDFPTGDHEQLLSSIKDKLLPLGDSVAVYPGHGNPSRIGGEKARNPFLR